MPIRRTTKKQSIRITKPLAQKDSVSISTSYVSLLYGVLTLLVVFSIIFLIFNFFSKKPQGTISQNAASTMRIPTKIANVPISNPLTQAPTAQPTQASPTVMVSPTIPPTTAIIPSEMPTNIPQPPQKQAGQNKTYTVVAGDNLWTIAQKLYNSGYSWVSIAQANNLSDPNVIHAGNQLVIPSVTPIVPQTAANNPAQAPPPPKVTPQVQASSQSITTPLYVVQHGDDLWNIAVRAYGDGYKWTQIAQANVLSDPSLIFSGNVLKIPR